jgi:integrase/recombinase XerD
MQEPSPSITEADRRSIDAFIERVWSEDGLADRTLEAYRRDLDGLARWLATQGQSLRSVQRQHLSAYHGSQPVAVRSLARRQSAVLTTRPC